MAIGENVEGDVGVPTVFEDGAPGFCPERQLMVGTIQIQPKVEPDNQPFYIWFFD